MSSVFEKKVLIFLRNGSFGFQKWTLSIAACVLRSLMMSGIFDIECECGDSNGGVKEANNVWKTRNNWCVIGEKW